MNRWMTRLLGEVCSINPKLIPSEVPPSDADITFVPMAAVDEVTGTITKPEVRQYKQVAKGYTPFRTNDILFAKITPCMQNGKAAIAHDLLGGIGFGSTEFHVLRPRESVLPQWVFAFIRQPSFRSAAEASFTGTAGQQRVPTDFLRQFPLPVPPLPEQERIVKLLDEADELRRLRRQADQRTTVLISAIFHEMFGDPETNPMGWSVRLLGEIAETTSGGTPDRKRSEYFGGGIAWVKSGELHNPDVTVTEETISQLGLENSSAKRMPPGTILLALYGATVGAVSRLAIQAATNQAVCCIRPGEEVDAQYLMDVIRLMTPKLLGQRVGGAQPNISQGIVRRLSIPIPPLQLQKQFAQKATDIRGLKATQAASRSRLNGLFQSLLHRAFAGEL